MNRNLKCVFMFLLGIGLGLFAGGCGQNRSNSSNLDFETVEYSKTFDEPKGLEELGPLVEDLIESNMGIDCAAEFESSPVEEISKLGLLPNDTLIVSIDVSELGLKYLSFQSVRNKKEIEMTPVYGTDSVYTVVNVFFGKPEFDEPWQTVKDFVYKSTLFASMFAYCVVENDRIKEIQSVCSKWPKYDDIKLNAFSLRSFAGKIKYKRKKESVIDSCFRDIKDYEVLHDSATTIFSEPICKEDIDSLLDRVLCSLPFAKVLSIGYDYEDKTLKDYVSDDDTLYYMLEQRYSGGFMLSVVSVEGSNGNNYNRLRRIYTNSRYEGYEFKSPQYLWNDIEEHTGINRDPLNFTALIIFYVKDGYIWKMKRIDDLTKGMRKYYNILAADK